MKLEDVYLKMMSGMSETERADFLAGLKALGIPNPAARAALRESFRRANPDWTDAQVEIAVAGR